MRTSERAWGLALCGLTALGAGCASTHGEAAGNPTAQRTEASQQQSQQALEQASDAQKKASEQGKEAGKAQDQVQKDQQTLTKDQQKARDEEAKAQELQQQATQATQQGAQTAQQQQKQASQSLSEERQQAAKNELVTSGQVTHSTASRVSVRTPDGSSMAFRVTNQTRVLVDGKAAGAAKIPTGADAHVTYRISGGEPLALRVQAATGAAGSLGSGAGATGEAEQPGQGGMGSSAPAGQ
jgi:hypothetical protein